MQKSKWFIKRLLFALILTPSASDATYTNPYIIYTRVNNILWGIVHVHRQLNACYNIDATVVKFKAIPCHFRLIMHITYSNIWRRNRLTKRDTIALNNFWCHSQTKVLWTLHVFKLGQHRLFTSLYMYA